MSTPRWEDRWPGHFQRELDALHAAGIPFEVDDAYLKHRILRISFTHTVDGTDVRGTAIYPDLFPYFGPAVTSQPLGLTHHQNPFGGHLCLLGRGGDRWRPAFTLARMLIEQLPLVLSAGRPGASEEAIKREDVQAEPYSAYVTCEPKSVVLVDGRWEVPPDLQWGRLVLGTADGPHAEPLRAAVIEVRDGDGNIVASAEPATSAIYRRRHHGRWGRSALSNPESITSVIAEASAQVPDSAKSSCPSILVGGCKVRVLGILIPEEVAHRKTAEGWLFLVEPEVSVGGKKAQKRNRRYFARTAYAGRDDLSIRIPELAPLRGKTIALFGLGSLGAPAALEFARAGVGELRMLDRDFVDSGPVVRWPFGLKDVGRAKADVLHDFIREHYPYTKVVHHLCHELGEAATLGRKSDQHALDAMLDGADLVFDATANLNVQCMLADVARDRTLPYLMVEGRHGGWGGVIFRQDADPRAACLHCLFQSFEPKAEQGIMNAPAAPDDGVQARGCGDVTFTGTGFDMTTIALDAVRRAIGTLCAGEYPDPPGNLAVISLRGEDGAPSAPKWETTDMAQHPACDCSADAA